MKWYNPQSEPFEIYGFPFYDKDRLYRRLPVTPGWELPEAVYRLGDETSGGQIRFHAKLKDLKIQVSLASRELYFHDYTAPHLSTITKKGFDLYVSVDGGDYTFVTVTSDFDESSLYYENTLLKLDEEAEADFLLHFPLYGAVDKVLLGFDDEAEISHCRKGFKDDRRIAVYGGSIEQGACASRPGMCTSNILSRLFDIEAINFGFNSSGKAEEEVARVITRTDRLCALIISTEGNCPDGAWIEQKLPRFIEIVRERYPYIPIVLMPFPKNGGGLINKTKLSVKTEKFEAQKKVYGDLLASGDQNIYFLNQDDYIMQQMCSVSMWHEIFTDGLHKTDPGYIAAAQGIYEMLKDIL